jgi:nitronate monooxygenase
VEEARQLAQAGVDAIVAQSAEAGSHRGTFAVSFEDAMVPLARLVGDICTSVELPVLPLAELWTDTMWPCD